MKKLQASYNEDANKLIEEATQDKAVENVNFLINLAMVTADTMPVEILKSFGFVGGIIDPCLYVKNSVKGAI